MNHKITRSVVKVTDIMKGKKNVILLHDKKRYALTITRRGKLILTAAEDALTAKIAINKTAATILE